MSTKIREPFTKVAWHVLIVCKETGTNLVIRFGGGKKTTDKEIFPIR